MWHSWWPPWQHTSLAAVTILVGKRFHILASLQHNILRQNSIFTDHSGIFDFQMWDYLSSLFLSPSHSWGEGGSLLQSSPGNATVVSSRMKLFRSGHLFVFVGVFVLVVELVSVVRRAWNLADRGDLHWLEMYTRWSWALPSALQHWAAVWRVSIPERRTDNQTTVWPLARPKPVVWWYVVNWCSFIYCILKY